MSVTGGFATLPGEGPLVRIGGYDALEPFLVSVTSPDDHWLFVSTSGALTAGRVSPERALFPYETDDRLHRAGGLRGPRTLLRVAGGEAPALWAPFEGDAAPGVTRNLYKSLLGDRLVFEEVHGGLGLTLRARWATSRAFGVVRTVTLERHAAAGAPAAVTVLDGLVDLQPALVPLQAVQTRSCLVDAYTRCERIPDQPLALCALEARIVDRPEPAEALRTTMVWSVGLGGATISLREDAVARFRRGQALDASGVVTARRGAFFQEAALTLAPGRAVTWHVVGEVHADHLAVAEVAERLRDPAALEAALEADLRDGHERLRRLVATVDGLQLTGDRAQTTAHAASTLFNAMRGGVFADGHRVPAADLAAFVRTRSRSTWARQQAFLEGLGDVELDAALTACEARSDPDLSRLALEYLPLWFSRRHGDPSRPWNGFAIRVTEPDGRRRLDWQGNWRDIFQNWEALCESFPGFATSTVVTFVNASTADGGNPYRITRDGMDWEVPEPDDAWSHIGYWGDHQIIYLLKLVELSRRVQPGRLEGLLERPLFTYADVPYRLAPFAAMLDDPHHTITFDHARHHATQTRVGAEGADGRLLHDAGGRLVRVTLVEKLLVPALAKLANLVVGGGVWMNTQRPEWNDANNALAGWGLSVVTAAHLHRYCRLMPELLAGVGREVWLSAEVAAWLDATREVLARADQLAAAERDAAARADLTRALGVAFTAYRGVLYDDGLSAPVPRPRADLVELFTLAADALARTLRVNRRGDGLYHAYNIMVPRLGGAEIALQRLPLMLEGQVALLDSGLVPPDEAAAMLDTLFASELYRPDQRSFVLYPAVTRPPFLERNRISADEADAVALLAALLAEGDGRVVARDASGAVRFHGDFASARDVAAALDGLAADERWRERVAADRAAVLTLWERVFRHRVYTGRSGTMYGYEGIGSIYWHMVSKLQLAVQEAYRRACTGDAPEAEVAGRLAAQYHALREGLGAAKSPAVQGAFPTDPHSHTPAHRGAQQPGMTGQAKEAVLVRWRELGVAVRDGRVGFAPTLLPRAELLAEAADFAFVDVHGADRSVAVPAGGIAFTTCQVPVVVRTDGAAPGSVAWWWRDGRRGEAEARLDAAASADLLGRRGRLDRIEVRIPREALWAP